MLNNIGQMSGLLNAMKGQDPQAFAMQMANRNPEFAKFLQQNKGKTVDQLASEYGIDMNMVNNLLR